MRQEINKTKTIFNPKARHDYTIGDSVEAGIVLTGAEVKSLNLGAASLKGSYVAVTGEGALLVNAQINPYRFSRNEEYDPKRSRRLLLHKREIEKLKGQAAVKGAVLVALKIYRKRGKYKVEIGVGRGKKRYEKREVLKRQAQRRELEREVKAKIRM